jgi:parallel beta-helix repeat protein
VLFVGSASATEYLNYSADVLPETFGFAKISGYTTNVTESVNSGIYTYGSSSVAEKLQYRYTLTDDINTSDYNLTFRLTDLAALSPEKVEFSVYDGEYVETVVIYNNGVDFAYSASTNTSVSTTDTDHIYRFNRQGTTVSLYQDDVLVLTDTSSTASTYKRVEFGEGSSSYYSNFSLDYIVFSDASGESPVDPDDPDAPGTEIYVDGTESISNSGVIDYTSLNAYINNLTVLNHSNTTWFQNKKFHFDTGTTFHINNSDATRVFLYSTNSSVANLNFLSRVDIVGTTISSWDYDIYNYDGFVDTSNTTREIPRASITLKDGSISDSSFNELGYAGEYDGANGVDSSHWVSGICVNQSDSYDVFDNNTIFNGWFGFEIYDSDNKVISNNTITKDSDFTSGEGRGIEIAGSTQSADPNNLTIRDNNVSIGHGYAIRMENAGTNHEVYNNYFSGSCGMEMYTRNSGDHVYNNTYVGNSYGSTTWAVRYGGYDHLIHDEYITMTSAKSKAALMIDQNMNQYNISMSNMTVVYESTEHVDDSYGHAVLVVTGTDINLNSSTITTTSSTNTMRVSEDYYTTEVYLYNTSLSGSEISSIVLNDDAYLSIDHCVIDMGSIGVDIRDTATLDITNSIIYNVTDGLVNTGSGTVTSDYNCIYASNESYIGVSQGSNDILADSLLNTDYTLQDGSPCINNSSTGGDIGLVFSTSNPGTEPVIPLTIISYTGDELADYGYQENYSITANKTITGYLQVDGSTVDTASGSTTLNFSWIPSVEAGDYSVSMNVTDGSTWDNSTVLTVNVFKGVEGAIYAGRLVQYTWSSGTFVRTAENATRTDTVIIGVEIRP